MIGSLFGNRNVERVLYFLFVNETCYGTQLQTLLGTPLTPLQKALERLEKEGVLSSHYEGKTRVYQFNDAYPLRSELEALLKKAYLQLPPSEKKQYCFLHKPRLSAKEEGLREKNRNRELLAVWERLSKVSQLSLIAKSRAREEKSLKTGCAEVTLSSPAPSTLLFQEKGHWFCEGVAESSFSNVFRWTLDLAAGVIGLEHLRYGANRPVFLFHLTATQPGVLEAVDAHLCADDVYLGNIAWNQEQIKLHWRMVGPRKNDELIYTYR